MGEVPSLLMQVTARCSFCGCVDNMMCKSCASLIKRVSVSSKHWNVHQHYHRNWDELLIQVILISEHEKIKYKLCDISISLCKRMDHSLQYVCYTDLQTLCWCHLNLMNCCGQDVCLLVYCKHTDQFVNCFILWDFLLLWIVFLVWGSSHFCLGDCIKNHWTENNLHHSRI